ncbi:MAG: transcription termination factor NusA [Candidatus Paceibacterota bacterium]|jgi:N utilization substance protein A
MFDLKVIHSVLAQLEEERGIPKEKILEAIEAALATAYKKEYGKRGQIVRATFDINTGKTDFYQIKMVVDPAQVLMEDEIPADDDERTRFNPEHHMLLEDAKKMKKGVAVDDEMVFPLDPKGDFGRIAAQTAKQVIIQKIREAEKVSVFGEFGEKEGSIVTGQVQRIERGNIYFDMGRASGILPYEEQIPGERYRQGEKVRMYLTKVEETPRGVFLRLSRAHPQFLEKLFETEVPEIVAGTVSIRAIAREAGSRSKVAVFSTDSHIDPIGSMVGQRGVRVSTVMSELGGEKIDIIEWSEDHAKFVEDSLSPARVESVEVNEETNTATVTVADDQQSLAIGRGGQNVRLAAKLTGYRIDIKSSGAPATPKEEEKAVEAVPEEVPETKEADTITE